MFLTSFLTLYLGRSASGELYAQLARGCASYVTGLYDGLISDHLGLEVNGYLDLIDCTRVLGRL